MADFFTNFSCVLDVGTPDNAARALALYNAFGEEAAREDVPSDGFLLSIRPVGGASNGRTPARSHASTPSAVARMCSISRAARPFRGPTPTAGWPGPSPHLVESEVGDEHPRSRARKLPDAAPRGSGQKSRAHGVQRRRDGRAALRHLCRWPRRNGFPVHALRPSRRWQPVRRLPAAVRTPGRPIGLLIPPLLGLSERGGSRANGQAAPASFD